MIFNDSVELTRNLRKTPEGYLVGRARVARTGVQEYLGKEVGRPEMDRVRVYRPPESVFSDQAMRSYAHRPMTNSHPPGHVVNSQNWKSVAVGQTGGDILQDGKFVDVPLVMMDAAAIADYEAGKCELSMGYSSELIFEDGVTPDGEAYDARTGDMRMNHLALEYRARGGEELRLGDGRGTEPADNAQQPKQRGHQMPGEIRKVLVDGLTIETSEQGAQVIERLMKQLADSGATLVQANTAHSTELAKRDAQIETLQKQVLTDAQVAKLVADQATLIANANKLVPADYTGKTPAQIKRHVVGVKLGDAALVAGKDDTYVDVRFDMMLEDAAKAPAVDPIRGHFQAADARPTDPKDNGQAAYHERTANAWKTPNGAQQ